MDCYEFEASLVYISKFQDSQSSIVIMSKRDGGRKGKGEKRRGRKKENKQKRGSQKDLHMLIEIYRQPVKMPVNSIVWLHLLKRNET